jgi:hypothetical protein
MKPPRGFMVDVKARTADLVTEWLDAPEPRSGSGNETRRRLGAITV